MTVPVKPPDDGNTAVERRPARGLSLFSGGLDSMLAICVLRAQGCHVEAVTFASPFFNLDTARASAQRLDVPLRIIDFTADITELIEDPPHGFGQTMNPCIDCHARMVQRAGERVREWGWDFVATGEVLNQRPMSQNRRSLAKVAEASGCTDLLIRPLSARLLEATPPEIDGRVDRSRLLALSGRSRRPQAILAAQYGIKAYPSPAGGCLLTERLFCSKLLDLQTHEGLSNVRDLHWLSLGRHFRLPDGAKCVVGRNRVENGLLEKERLPTDIVFDPLSAPGPTVVLSGLASAADEELAASICAGYCDATTVPVRILRVANNERREILAHPLAREVSRQWMVSADPRLAAKVES